MVCMYSTYFRMGVRAILACLDEAIIRFLHCLFWVHMCISHYIYDASI